MSEKHDCCNKENRDVQSDDSVIEASPCRAPVRKKLRVKNKAKFRNKLDRTPAGNVQSNKTDLLDHLIQEIDRNKIQEPSTSTSKATTQPITDLQEEQVMRPIYRGITEHIHKPVSKNYHNLFVFYLINEVLKFTPNNFPKNCCVQLIGRFKFDAQKRAYFLTSCEKNYGQNYQIKVDLREVPLRPSDGERISLFGAICFENNTPIVVAKFFQQSSVDYQTYVDLMLRLRTTVPGENFNMVCVTDDDLKYDETLEEQRNEEEFFHELTLKLSGERFESQELSDSRICAFLDDISFEKL